MQKEPRLNYYYAEIDPADGFCYGVSTSITEYNDERHIEIEGLNYDYLKKYYNKADGKWYEDAGFSIPWSPSK